MTSSAEVDSYGRYRAYSVPQPGEPSIDRYMENTVANQGASHLGDIAAAAANRLFRSIDVLQYPSSLDFTGSRIR
ncbi:hypothetical protein PENTCL1PPCAC_153 [Pristionchus entomophagus]|uniref:Uncharacterized protein n=1 Tax=Pristionchus entomophagus TaxID=358040 RepID=A0AAV5S836_9BILA|nr:hypothetical protein PENTCL1PPCAC_153 [Pristionchus entomophagus]